MKAASKATGTGAATTARGARVTSGRARQEAIVVVSAHRLLPHLPFITISPLALRCSRCVATVAAHVLHAPHCPVQRLLSVWHIWPEGQPERYTQWAV